MSGTLQISRRDFINGFALGVVAGSALSPLELMANTISSSRAVACPVSPRYLFVS